MKPANKCVYQTKCVLIQLFKFLNLGTIENQNINVAVSALKRTIVNLISLNVRFEPILKQLAVNAYNFMYTKVVFNCSEENIVQLLVCGNSHMWNRNLIGVAMLYGKGATERYCLIIIISRGSKPIIIMLFIDYMFMRFMLFFIIRKNVPVVVTNKSFAIHDDTFCSCIR